MRKEKHSSYENFYLKDASIHPKALSIINEAQTELRRVFEEIDERAEYHQARILKVFNEHRISQRHFTGTSGYGYGDDGRDALDLVYRDLFGGEDALVRPHWVSGTHVISDGLFALLRPG